MSHVVSASSEYGLKHSMASKKPAITNFFAGQCFDFLLTICAIVYSVFFYDVIETIIKHEKMLFFNGTFKMLFRRRDYFISIDAKNPWNFTGRCNFYFNGMLGKQITIINR